MARLFGTDGIRGVANRELTAELAVRLARAAGQVIGADDGNDHRKRVLVGRDTRASGEMLEAALAAGLCSAGLEVSLLGVVPTAAIAHLVKRLEARAGAMISASHNPFEYNGVKFFSGLGTKLPDHLEDRIEAVLAEHDPNGLPVGKGVGRITQDSSPRTLYLDHLVSQASGPLGGMKIVVDCANGAACEFAPQLFERLGARVVCLSCEPDGANINTGCGSTHPQAMLAKTKEAGADLGVAFDGDADRAIFSDETGALVDGDQVLAIWAHALHAQRRLDPPTVVGTLMTNLGLELSLKQIGCKLIRAKVGDRYVLEEMQKDGALIGGEGSGHVIFLDREMTGDGLLTAVLVADLVRRSGKRLSELTRVMSKLPQVLLNVAISDRESWKGNGQVAATIAAIEQRLGERGRLLVRPSGTEPVVRVMVEGEDEREVRAAAEEVASAIRGAST